MLISDLLYLIAREFKEKAGYAPSKTKLIKLAYLAEIFYKRYSDSRLTDSKWIFWKFGPYLMDYPTILSSIPFVPAEDDDFQPVEVNQDYMPSNVNISEESAISKALDFADEEINALLDFVYFDTEPMINAKERGEELDFNSVKSAQECKIKKYAVSPGIKKEIKDKIDNWKKRKSA